jgi:hypothetical protein
MQAVECCSLVAPPFLRCAAFHPFTSGEVVGQTVFRWAGPAHGFDGCRRIGNLGRTQITFQIRAKRSNRSNSPGNRHGGQAAGEIQVLQETNQALDYLAALLIKPGDVVIVEEPVSPDVYRTFALAGGKVVTVPMDEEGVICECLETLILKYNPRFIYVNPDYQNPTGVVMSLNRRKALLALAHVLQVGADKYARDNWRKIPAEEHFNHMIIHALAWLKGDTQDDHLGHMLCRAMMMYATGKTEEATKEGT